MLAAARRLLLPAAIAGPNGRHAAGITVRGVSGKASGEDWSDLNSVVKELRNVSREQGLGGSMPDTKLLKELGYGSLVLAIRKKHGGVVNVADKMGTPKDQEAVEMHKRLSARAKRRQKRQTKLGLHDFY